MDERLLKINSNQLSDNLKIYGYHMSGKDVERMKRRVAGFVTTTNFDTDFLIGKESNSIIFLLTKRGGTPLTTIVSSDLMTGMIKSSENKIQYSCSRINVDKVGHISIGLVRLATISKFFNFEDLNQIGDEYL